VGDHTERIERGRNGLVVSLVKIATLWVGARGKWKGRRGLTPARAIEGGGTRKKDLEKIRCVKKT